jgi:hypothetical protein
MSITSLPLTCIVIYKHPGECQLLNQKIQNDDRLVLLDVIDSAEELLPLRESFMPDLLFVEFDCCDAALVDYIQQLKKQIPIVFIEKKYDVSGSKGESYPYVFFYDLLELPFWNELREKVVAEIAVMGCVMTDG